MWYGAMRKMGDGIGRLHRVSKCTLTHNIIFVVSSLNVYLKTWELLLAPIPWNILYMNLSTILHWKWTDNLQLIPQPCSKFTETITIPSGLLLSLLSSSCSFEVSGFVIGAIDEYNISRGSKCTCSNRQNIFSCIEDRGYIVSNCLSLYIYECLYNRFVEKTGERIKGCEWKSEIMHIK